MEVWITYSGAHSLWSRGLKAVSIWLRKPFYVFSQADPENDPFIRSADNGILDEGWRQHSGPMQYAIVFSEMIGYSDGDDPKKALIAQYVWLKITDHFKGARFGKDWVELESSGQVLSKNFLLKIDLSIEFKQQTT